MRRTLSDSPLGIRLALSLLLLVLSGGFLASLAHMAEHHGMRDGTEGLGYDDVRGVYSGVRSVAPLRSVLLAGHPGEIEGATPLSPGKKAALLEWLALEANALSQRYDDLDAGSMAPAEILTAGCIRCHRRGSEDPKASRIPLEYWDDVEKLAISREIAPMAPEILLATTHTHALALATTSLVLVLLLLVSRWPSKLRGGLAFAMALGLTIDLAAWWLARASAAFVPLILAGGALYGLGTALLIVLLFVDLWLPLKGTHTERAP